MHKQNIFPPPKNIASTQRLLPENLTIPFFLKKDHEQRICKNSAHTHRPTCVERQPPHAHPLRSLCRPAADGLLRTRATSAHIQSPTSHPPSRTVRRQSALLHGAMGMERVSSAQSPHQVDRTRAAADHSDRAHHHLHPASSRRKPHHSSPDRRLSPTLLPTPSPRPSHPKPPIC